MRKIAKTRRGKKYLENIAPKIDENRKKSLFILGKRFPRKLKDLWTDLKYLRSGELKSFSENNDVYPFESTEKIEHFCEKNNCSLFTFGCRTVKKKKDKSVQERNTLVFGRLFDGVVMDMYEFYVENYVEKRDLPGHIIEPGSIPALIFEGDQWDNELKMLKSYFMDYFVGKLGEFVDMYQISRVIVLTHDPDGKKILFRHYNVKDEKGTKRLEKSSPCFDLVRAREKLPDEEVLAIAMNTAPGPKKKKNIKRDGLDRDIGRVFIGKQDTTEIKLRHFPGLKNHEQSPLIDDAM